MVHCIEQKVHGPIEQGVRNADRPSCGSSFNDRFGSRHVSSCDTFSFSKLDEETGTGQPVPVSYPPVSSPPAAVGGRDCLRQPLNQHLLLAASGSLGRVFRGLRQGSFDQQVLHRHARGDFRATNTAADVRRRIPRRRTGYCCPSAAY